MKKKTKIDLNQLAKEIGEMRRYDPLYRVIRDSLIERGNWKQRGRWHPPAYNFKRKEHGESN